MGTISVAKEGVIPASPATAYGYLADMHEHERFLPPAFSNFTVESGGVGAGSVVTFTITAGGRSRPYRMTVSEPAPGTLVETDANSTLVTTFTVTAHGDDALVKIATTWQGAGGVGGFFERRFAPKVMEKLYADELERFAAFVLERASESARVDEADEESFPASDPPAF
jgi:Polyketide cyclase / dehydrase and lipid transport